MTRITITLASTCAAILVANTAFAFTLWNHTLRTLTAVESSIIGNLMLPQIAVLAWVFLGEALTPRQKAALIVVHQQPGLNQNDQASAVVKVTGRPRWTH